MKKMSGAGRGRAEEVRGLSLAENTGVGERCTETLIIKMINQVQSCVHTVQGGKRITIISESVLSIWHIVSAQEKFDE